MNKTLLVFLTFKSSLSLWNNTGLLDRELKYYEELSKKKKLDITLFSYGDNHDQKILRNRNSILCLITLCNNYKNKNNFSIFFYSIFFIIKNKKIFNKFDYFKSNQLY